MFEHFVIDTFIIYCCCCYCYYYCDVGFQPRSKPLTKLAIYMYCTELQSTVTKDQGQVVRSRVSANHWLRGMKTYRFPWYLTLVSANHASSNLGQGKGPEVMSCILEVPG